MKACSAHVYCFRAESLSHAKLASAVKALGLLRFCAPRTSRSFNKKLLGEPKQASLQLSQQKGQQA